MPKLLFIAGVVMWMPAIASAQDYPRAEASAGYSYLRGTFDANFNGWNFSVAGNPTRWFGVAGEVGGLYISNAQIYTFLAGPRLTSRAGRANPYAQVLFGGVNISTGYSETAFGWAVGGGVDIKVNKRIAIRAIDVTYLQTRFGGQAQHNGRLSAGVVFRFGEK